MFVTIDFWAPAVDAVRRIATALGMTRRHMLPPSSACENEKDSNDPDSKRDQNSTHSEPNPSLIRHARSKQHRHECAVGRRQQLGETGAHLIREHGRLA